MRDDDAFLAAIRADPGDDLPRLVYADYLDERGDPRGPFLRLDPGAAVAPARTEPERLPLKPRTGPATRPCSVCGRPFEDRRLHRVWVSLRVATDVLPLLVNACSAACVGRLPAPPDNYVRTPHTGGPSVRQPNPQ